MDGQANLRCCKVSHDSFLYESVVMGDVLMSCCIVIFAVAMTE